MLQTRDAFQHAMRYVYAQVRTSITSLPPISGQTGYHRRVCFYVQSSFLKRNVSLRRKRPKRFIKLALDDDALPPPSFGLDVR